MEQDLFSWLNSQKKLQGADLLVAPLSQGTPDNMAVLNGDSLPKDSGLENHIADSESEYGNLSAYVQNELAGNQAVDSELSQQQPLENPENESAIDFSDTQNANSHKDLSLYVPNYTSENQVTDSEAEYRNFSAYVRNELAGNQAVDSESSQQQLPENPENGSAMDFSDTQNANGHEDLSLYVPNGTSENQVIDSESGYEDSTAYNQNDTAESESGYDESAEYVPQDSHTDDEPIPQDHEWQERATGFTLSLDEPPPELWTHINDDDPDPEYEPTDSLQGAAYVQIHGRNFTERLHHTLKHRKERAEERAQAENDNTPSKTLMHMTVILCATLVMVLGFAFLALWFIGRETPEGMKRRAESLAEAGNFEEAAEIYRRAHRRYPDNPEFLAGLSESSEKAGHPQTAKAARDEYENKISVPESKDNSPKPEAPQTSRNIIPQEKPKTFTDYLNEGNYAYNIGMYNRAVINFFRAMSMNSRDIRPYLGLAASYRMKGMYFDSNRILEEARRLFGRSPAVDMGLYFLREAK